MQTVNNLIFSSQNALNGQWQDVSNMVMLSIQVVNLEGKVWIEISNDPNIKTDGANSVAAPAAPTLSQFAYGALTSQGTADIKITYTTKAGETLPSNATTLALTDDHTLQVTSPTQDAGGLATGYNVYAKINGVYVLQNSNNFGPYTDSYPGPIPIGTPFIARFGLFASGVAAPVADTSGGSGVGVNIQGAGGNLVGAPSVNEDISIIADTTNGGQVMVSPSSMTWKYVRVCKDATAQTKITEAWLAGAMG